MKKTCLRVLCLCLVLSLLAAVCPIAGVSAVTAGESFEKEDGVWYYTRDGQRDPGANTFVKYRGVWFYVTAGKIDWTFTGAAVYRGVLFRVKNAQIDWSFTGPVKWNGIWFYLENGQTDGNRETLMKYQGIWFHVKDSQVVWDTAVVPFADTAFYVKDGSIAWNECGTVTAGGAVYAVKHGEAVLLEEPTRRLAANAKYPQMTNLPTLYITLNDGKTADEINKDDYFAGTYSLVGYDKDVIEKPISIKGRGNATWNYVKKPYALKFGSKTDMLGMGKAKKWVLLADANDKTHLRNNLTLTLARQMGLRFSVEGKYVDVVLNGDYIGLYLLTEKIQLNAERVDVDAEEGGALLEIEAISRHETHDLCIPVFGSHHAMFSDPEPGDLEDEAFKALFSQTSGLVASFNNSLSQGYSAYSRYIDVDSFVDWYIVNEFVKNWDSAFTSSCYCYVNEQGKLCMGPCWDYDTCLGNQDIGTGDDNGVNYNGFHVSRSPWYSRLTNDKTFMGLVERRWRAVRLDGYFEDFIAAIDEIVPTLSQSYALDAKRWPTLLSTGDLRGKGDVYPWAVPYTTQTQEVAYLRMWATKRVAYLDSRWL